jgi:hypothetical protein
VEPRDGGEIDGFAVEGIADVLVLVHGVCEKRLKNGEMVIIYLRNVTKGRKQKGMIPWLSTVLHRPTFRADSQLHARRRRTRTQSSQFVSFLKDSGFRRVNPDLYESAMRRRRIVMTVLGWATVIGFTWIVIESAQALSMF